MHNDIKPENIVRVGDDWKLIDFDRCTRALWHADAVLGSQEVEEGDSKYLAPETLGTGSTVEADLFALGQSLREAWNSLSPADRAATQATEAYFVEHMMNADPRARRMARVALKECPLN